MERRRSSSRERVVLGAPALDVGEIERIPLHGEDVARVVAILVPIPAHLLDDHEVRQTRFPQGSQRRDDGVSRAHAGGCLSKSRARPVAESARSDGALPLPPARHRNAGTVPGCRRASRLATARNAPDRRRTSPPASAAAPGGLFRGRFRPSAAGVRSARPCAKIVAAFVRACTENGWGKMRPKRRGDAI